MLSAFFLTIFLDLLWVFAIVQLSTDTRTRPPRDTSGFVMFTLLCLTCTCLFVLPLFVH
jgi:hypothetical protein